MNRAKARDMINRLSSPDTVSLPAKAELEQAVRQDLDNAEPQVAADSVERLKKLEGQVQALSEAIIVIAEPSASVDDAVQAVKDKM